MGRHCQISEGVLRRAGPPKDDVAGWPGWSATQVAWAIGCSEQTVCTWHRQGRIPRAEVTVWGLRFPESALVTMQAEGVQDIGHYSPITKGEIARLRRAGRKESTAYRKATDGGAK